ncbi:MAG TPA: antibiotic biosynthesis monooxygenase [Candidatus Polarisedimenticolaceae bacterium]|nr:antibiotic biosynthesis monooxygenase [Candidatus Polarisedimenticolaceae bacterium]
MSFGRNVQFTVKAGKVDEFKRLMNTDVLPVMKKEKGFRQIVTVVEKNTGLSLSVWDDRACAETYNTKTFPEVLKKLNAVLEGTPTVHMYETVLALTPDVVHA